MVNREIELLAPARDLTTGIEAIRHGADAVYIGAPKFGARAAAGNSVDDIRQLVEFAHPYGVKVYVTLNTIIFDHELEEAHQLAGELANIGVDALIVQDFSFLNEELRLHASTQMDNRTAEKVRWLRDLGFEQVVLARELTLDEIREIHEQVPDVRLEVFVHGAICVSYNGQCYASQHCFGRSANRGECAQFCRMPFDLIDEEGNVLQRQKHLLSLRDMNRSDDLEALLDAGVSSLKIEGRLKDAGYVKNVVAYYRQRLDEIFRRRNEYKRSSLGHETISFTPNPAKSFNRLFTNYFLHGRTPEMANIHTPKSMGEPVTAQTELHNGDGLCFINEEGMLEGFRINNVEKDLPRGTMREGLYRNHDQQFEQLLSKPTATRKVGISWLLQDVEGGFLLRLTREDGKQVEQTFEYPHELARSPQEESITRQLSRLGDTPYEATNIDIHLSQNWFIPNSLLAEWRRRTLPLPSLKGREKNVSPLESGKVTTPLSNRATGAFRESTECGFGPTKGSKSPLATVVGRGGESITYLANISNHVARRFYIEQGAKQVEWAMEVEKPQTKDEGILIMTCRYCIRYELGLCLKNKQEHRGGLLLRLSDGRKFRLHFDCKQCQMRVYGNE